MKKQEYAKANKEWLQEKAKEEGVKEIPGGIYYKVVKEGLNDGRHPSRRSIVTAHYTAEPSTARSSTPRSAEHRSPYASPTSSTDGLSPCSRCVLATNGRCISLPRKATASSRNREYLAAPRSSSRSNCWALPDRIYTEDCQAYGLHCFPINL